MKNSYVRKVGLIPSGCPAGYTIEAGLCYRDCDAGFKGIGPVCWGAPPSGWVQCGMGAASDDKSCASTIFDQVSSVGNLALNIATGFSSGAASAASDVGSLTEKFNQLKEAAKNSAVIQQGLQAWKDTEGARMLIKAGQAIDFSTQIYTEEDMLRLSALVASIVDPTGVASVVAAYSYAKCSKLVALG